MSVWEEDQLGSEVVLPPLEFLFTLTQIQDMLQVSRDYLVDNILWMRGRSHNSPRGRLQSINIASPGDTPVWRVSETDFKLWMRSKGISFTEPVNIKLRKKSTSVRG